MTIESMEFDKVLQNYTLSSCDADSRKKLVAYIDAKMRERDLKLIAATHDECIYHYNFYGSRTTIDTQSIIDEVDKLDGSITLQKAETTGNLKTWPESIFLYSSLPDNSFEMMDVEWDTIRSEDDEVEYVRKDLVKEMPKDRLSIIDEAGKS